MPITEEQVQEVLAREDFVLPFEVRNVLRPLCEDWLRLRQAVKDAPEQYAKIAESMPSIVAEGKAGWEHAKGWTAAGEVIADKIRETRLEKADV